MNEKMEMTKSVIREQLVNQKMIMRTKCKLNWMKNIKVGHEFKEHSIIVCPIIGNPLS